MANRATVKIGPAINAKLYKEFVAVAKENDNPRDSCWRRPSSITFITSYLLSARYDRKRLMLRRSNEKFRDLYRKLAE